MSSCCFGSGSAVTSKAGRFVMEFAQSASAALDFSASGVAASVGVVSAYL
jgi:hypothetical protein